MRRAAARAIAVILPPLSSTMWSAGALAYRPFDGTDAAVADPGEMEIEFAPLGYQRQGAERTLNAPTARFNYAFAERWEAVLEGAATHALSGDRRSSLVANAASLKYVLREGSLQQKSGPSVGTEFALLLPGINDEPGLGGSVAGVVSQQWPWGTLHVNLAGAVTRQQHGDVFISAIGEGPHDWAVRPVAEIFHEREFGRQRTSSGLVGAIWQVRDTLSIDAAVRGGRVNARALGEIRLGLTFGLGLR
jgi:hypothetical protein